VLTTFADVVFDVFVAYKDGLLDELITETDYELI
jgi:hypothetical protein